MEENKVTISKGKKIYNIVSTVVISIIFVLLVILVATMLIQRSNGADASIFGYYIFEVQTDSMSGTIEAHEVIVCKKVKDISALKEGDIITFIAPSGPLKGYNETHRIYEIVRDESGNIEYLRTKGDKEGLGVDEWHLDPKEVKCVFAKKSTFIAGLREFMRHWYGYVVLIAIPLTIVGTLLIVGFVSDKWKKIKEEEKSQTKVTLDSMTEEQKKQLLGEYLASNGNASNECEPQSETSLDEACEQGDSIGVSGEQEE